MVSKRKVINETKEEIRKTGPLYRFYRRFCRVFNLGPEDYYVIINKWKVIFFYIPKNGNTSLKRAIYKKLYGKDTNRLHHDFPKTRKGRLDKKRYKDYFKFAFVRNPYDRIVSAYKDKIKSYGQTGVINSEKEFYEDMPFGEFVKVIYNTPDKKIDRHFRSQSWFLTDKHRRLIPDFIGKFENLEEDYKKAMKKIGIKNPPKLPKENKTKKLKTSYREYYGEETKKLVYERYKKDFELFGYDKKL